MLRKVIIYFILIATLVIAGFMAFAYYATYSEGTRSGELIKFSSKGYVFKTWEGEISQGISGAQIFSFSVMDSEKDIIQKLNDYQGKYVKVSYIERYKTFPFWGDTKYFIVGIEEDTSPHFGIK